MTVLLALLIDHLLGEPPVRWHPVVWMGNYLGWAGQRVAPLAHAPRPARDGRAFVWGALAWSAGALPVVALAWGLQAGLAWLSAQWLPWGTWLGVLGLAVLLKPLLAWAMLRSEVQAVEAALAQSLPAGRERLSWLVSRDVTRLTDTEVRESAIETLAENLNDSVIAPIFWFVLLGLPGAALYRYANTADAMWGYREVRGGRQWLWAGKWAARVDDALSWLPARITALLLMCGALLLSLGQCAPVRWQALACLPQQSRITPSPNGGWPMATVALLLGIRLGKPGVYVLNPSGHAPAATDTQRAVRCAAAAIGVLLLALLPWAGGTAW